MFTRLCINNVHRYKKSLFLLSEVRKVSRPAGKPVTSITESKLIVNRLSNASFVLLFLDMPCIKRVYKNKKRPFSIVWLPGTKRVFRPDDKPLINRWSTVDFVPPSVYIGFRFFVLLTNVEATFFQWLGKNSGLFFPGQIVLLAPKLARPRPAAAPGALSQTALGMSGFWIRHVGLHKISLVRAYRKLLKLVVLDTFENARGACSVCSLCQQGDFIAVHACQQPV